MVGEAVQVEVAGRPAWMPEKRLAWLEEPAPASPLVHLLPRYDNYLLGHASRGLVVDPGFEKRIHPGGGIIHALVLVDGRAAGTWELKRRRGGLELAVEPFEEFPPAVVDGIKTETTKISDFLREDVVTV